MTASYWPAGGEDLLVGNHAARFISDEEVVGAIHRGNDDRHGEGSNNNAEEFPFLLVGGGRSDPVADFEIAHEGARSG